MNATRCLFFLMCLSFSCFAQNVNEQEMQKQMLEKTKKALLSYEIVEERANYVADKIKQTVFEGLGEYSKPLAAAIPFMTGKLDFKYKRLKFSYNYFAEKAELDYELSDDWKVFYDHKASHFGPEDKSGVQYSFNF